MNNFDVIFINTTWLLLPLVIFLIYEAYSENVNSKRTDLILKFCLISSVYLIIRYSGIESNIYILGITFDTIILITYIKKHSVTALIMSIVVIIYLKHQFDIEILVIIFNYITYFCLYLLYKNKQKYYTTLTLISRFFFFVSIAIVNNIKSNQLLEYIVYYIVTYIIIIFLIKGEKIIEINISYKELMKEHQLRESLFKISHEIKNPIAVCKGYLDMYESSENFEKYIPIIKSEINKTLNLLQDFSAFKKIKIEHDIIDISLIINDIEENFRLLFDKQKIALKIDVIDDEIYIMGDYNRLNQVFLNIIKNSIEAIDHNKKSYIKISTEMMDKKIKIIIEDNGIGISKENLKKVSEPFFTTKQQGTGLGVLLSKEIISAHHGTLEYESEETIGTKVTITLPLYEY